MSWRFRPFLAQGRRARAQFSLWIGVLPPIDKPATHVPFPAIHEGTAIRITLRRTSCFGRCPAYSVTLDGAGSVVFQGTWYVLVPGLHRSRILPRSVMELVDRFRQAGFYSPGDGYSARVTDLPTYMLSLAIAGRVKSVLDYDGLFVGMPPAVAELEDAVDRAANTR